MPGGWATGRIDQRDDVLAVRDKVSISRVSRIGLPVRIPGKTGGALLVERHMLTTQPEAMTAAESLTLHLAKAG